MSMCLFEKNAPMSFFLIKEVSIDPRWESVAGSVQSAGYVQVTAEGATAPETLRPMYRAGRHLWKVDARVTPKG